MTELQQKILDLWPDHTAREIAEQLGCNRRYAQFTASRFHARHSDEVYARIAKSFSEAGKHKHTPQSRRKISETRKKLFRSEYRRVLYEQPRRSNLRLKHVPERVYFAKAHLINAYGYIPTTDPYTLFYDETTKVMPDKAPDTRGHGHDYYHKKYGIRFIADYQNNDTK